LAICSTQQTVPYLTEQFYGENHSIQSRLDILRVLTEAAKELSGNKMDDSDRDTLEDNSSKSKGTPFEIVSGFASDGFREQSVGRVVKVRYHPSEILSGKIQQHTRKWGDLARRNSARPVGKANPFDNCCGIFFFPLIKDFDNPRNRFNLLGEDSLVLAQLLYSLGVFLESASCRNPVGERMIASTLEISWAIRLHPEAFVRRSIFFAVGRAFLKATKEIIMKQVEDLAVNWKEFLEDNTEMEPDVQARELALVALLSLKHSLES